MGQDNEGSPDVGEPFLFILPHGGRLLLMSILDILRYRATYRIEGYDYTDFDELQSIVEATDRGLMDGESVYEIAEAIRYLADSLEPCSNVQTVDVTCGSGGGDGLYCVDDDGNVTINPPPIGDSPTEPGIDIPDGVTIPDDITPNEGDPPDGFVSWQAWDTEACEAANAIVEWGRQICIKLSNFFGGELQTLALVIVAVVALLDGGWALLFSRAAIIKMGEILWKLQDSIDVSDYFQDKADWIADNRQELVCMLYNKRESAARWENDYLAMILGASAGSMASAAEQSLAEELLGFMVAPLLAAQQLYGGLTYDVADAYVTCGCVEVGVWETQWNIADDTTEAVSWNTSDRFIASVSGERHSSFSGGNYQIWQEFEPALSNTEDITINLLNDDRFVMGDVKYKLTSGVGISQGSGTLSLGVNTIPAGANVNKIAIWSEIQREVAGQQSWAFDLSIQFTQQGA